MATTATIQLGDKSIECPVIVGTENEVGIDIQVFRDKTGAVTFDPGYGNTGACESAVTFLDGENGILRYRGYPIEQLAGPASFLEVSWLLLKGELPNAAELGAFEAAEKSHRDLPEFAVAVIKALPQNVHPMAALAAVVVALSSVEDSPKATEAGLIKNELRLFAQLPTLAAYIYRHSQGLDFVAPDANLSYAANYLNMMFKGTKFATNDDSIAKALDLLFILHADHEQNCSTSSVRLVGSAQANLSASLAAGIRCYIEFGIEYPHQYRLVFGNVPSDDFTESAESNLLGRQALEHLVRIIAVGQQAGHFPATTDPTADALIVWSHMHGITSILINDHGRYNFPWPSKESMIQRSIDLITKALQSPATA